MNQEFINYENGLISDLNESYNKLMNQIENHKFKSNSDLNNFIDKVSVISSKINNLNNDINNLYINLLEQKVDIKPNEKNEIAIEKKYQKIIQKMLPAILIHSLYDLE